MKIYLSRRKNIKFNIKIYSETAKQYLLYAIAGLLVLCVITGTICLCLELQFKRYTIEAGQKVTAADITGDANAYFEGTHDPDIFDHAGVYYIYINTKGKQLKVRLKVRDTKAPKITVKDVYFAVGAPFPEPEEFIDTVVEADDFSGKYLTELPKLTSIGRHTVKVQFTDRSGNKTQVFEVTMIQKYDTEPPKLEAPSVITTTPNTPIDYDKYIKLTDDCTGKLSYTVDESSLDLSREGEYTVTVTATDAVGNKSDKYTLRVEVAEQIENETE